MRFRIDFSVSTADGEYVGRVHGELEISGDARIGDTISLMMGPGGEAIPEGHQLGGLLVVTSRVLMPSAIDPLVTLALSDMVVRRRDDARRIVGYMESAFGLFYDGPSSKEWEEP